MLAINDVNLAKKFFAAVELLSVLDAALAAGRCAIIYAVWHQEHGLMRPFYEEMAMAMNLHAAARTALTTSATRQLDSDSVQTLIMLSQSASLRAVSAMDFVIANRSDINSAVTFRDRFKSAWESSESAIKACE